MVESTTVVAGAGHWSLSTINEFLLLTLLFVDDEKVETELVDDNGDLVGAAIGAKASTTVNAATATTTNKRRRTKDGDLNMVWLLLLFLFLFGKK